MMSMAKCSLTTRTRVTKQANSKSFLILFDYSLQILVSSASIESFACIS